MFLIQLELPKRCAGRGPEIPFFIGDAIAVAGQVDTEDILTVEDEVAFFFHAQRVVHLIPFGLLAVLSGIGRRSVGSILRIQLENQGGGENSQEYVPKSVAH
jgi:hypothetical protein